MNTKLNIESIIDGSIEKGKLSESVQESLNKADNAMQSTDVETLLEDFVHKDDTINFANDLTGVVEATPEEFTYRPSAGDKSVRDESAVIRRIKGNTSVWGQLISGVSNDSMVSSVKEGDAWILTPIGDSVSPGSSNWSSGWSSFKIPHTLNSDHIYLYCVTFTKISKRTDIGDFDVNANYLSLGGECIKLDADFGQRMTAWMISKIGSTPNTIYLSLNDCVTKIENPMLFDLTDLFGTGNEPTTLEEFRQYYPDVYYPYCVPEVRSMKATGIETVGFNQWDEEWENGTFNTENGTNIANNQIRCKNLIRIFPNTYYSLSIGNTGIWAMFYDDNQNILQPVNLNSTVSKKCLYISPSSNRNVFLTPENASWMKFYLPSEYGSSTYKGDISINLSHSGVRNGEYEPYEKNTLLLPEIAKYFPDGMHGIGDVCDEIIDGLAIHRCAVRAYEEGDENNAEVKTDKITTVYKLSEPIYTPIDEPLQLDYKVDDFGTEKMLSDAPSSPFKADIVYQFNAEGRIRDNSRNIERLENNIIDIRNTAVQVGTSNDTTSSQTYYGLKAYADSRYNSLNSSKANKADVMQSDMAIITSNSPAFVKNNPIWEGIGILTLTPNNSSRPAIFTRNVHGQRLYFYSNEAQIDNSIVSLTYKVYNSQTESPQTVFIKNSAGVAVIRIQYVGPTTISVESTVSATLQIFQAKELPLENIPSQVQQADFHVENPSAVGYIANLPFGTKVLAKITELKTYEFSNSIDFVAIKTYDKTSGGEISGAIALQLNDMYELEFVNVSGFNGKIKFTLSNDTVHTTLTVESVSGDTGAYNGWLEYVDIYALVNVSLGGEYISDSISRVGSEEDTQDKNTIYGVKAYVRDNKADWDNKNPSSAGYIANKPFGMVAVKMNYDELNQPTQSNDNVVEKISSTGNYLLKYPYDNQGAIKIIISSKDGKNIIHEKTLPVGDSFTASPPNGYSGNVIFSLTSGGNLNVRGYNETYNGWLGEFDVYALASVDIKLYDSDIPNSIARVGTTSDTKDKNTIYGVKAYIDEQILANTEAINTVASTSSAKYNKPSDGIPTTDLNTDIQISLEKADTSIQGLSYKNVSGVTTTLSKDNSGNIELPTASTSKSGLTSLSSLVNSNVENKAATPKAVKQAYDLANSKYTKPNEGISYEDLHESVQGDLGRASLALILSDLNYEVVSFTIDELDDAYLNNRGYLDIGFADYSCFQQYKRVVIKQNENSDAVYPLTFTKQDANISGSYAGRVSFNAKGISYEFDISINMTMGTGSISNINKRANTHIADFTLNDLYGIDYGYDFTFDISSLYNAIINKQTIIIRNDVDSAGISTLNYINVLYVNEEYDKIECHIPTRIGYYILSELMYNKTERGSQTCTVTSSNVKFHYSDPYIMDITIEDLDYLLSGQSQGMSFNSNALRDAFDMGRPVIIKNELGGNFVVTGYSDDLLYFLVLTESCIYMVDVGYNVNTIDSSSVSIRRISLYNIKSTVDNVNSSFNFDGGVKRIVGSDDILYALPGTADGEEDVILLGDTNVKTINNKSIYKSSSTDTNIYTYYPLIYTTRTSTRISPNYLYQFGKPGVPVSGNLNIMLGAGISNYVNEYIFEIYIKDTVPTLVLTPQNETDTIKWVSGDAPVLEENKIYQISIINNLGTVLSWDNV